MPDNIGQLRDDPQFQALPPEEKRRVFDQVAAGDWLYQQADTHTQRAARAELVFGPDSTAAKAAHSIANRVAGRDLPAESKGPTAPEPASPGVGGEGFVPGRDFPSMLKAAGQQLFDGVALKPGPQRVFDALTSSAWAGATNPDANPNMQLQNQVLGPGAFGQTLETAAQALPQLDQPPLQPDFSMRTGRPMPTAPAPAPTSGGFGPAQAGDLLQSGVAAAGQAATLQNAALAAGFEALPLLPRLFPTSEAAAQLAPQLHQIMRAQIPLHAADAMAEGYGQGGVPEALSRGVENVASMAPFLHGAFAKEVPEGRGGQEIVAPDASLLDAVAQKYHSERGLPPPTRESHQPLNVQRSREIGQQYENLPDVDRSPKTVAAYDAMKGEIKDQWNALQEAGFKLEPWTQEGRPYANSKEMRQDVQQNRHLYFFTGGEVHPYLGEVDPQTGLTYNDMFRATHDILGHARSGVEFGPKGEEAAFRSHAQSYGPDAREALATETRGQNSWVNFGPHGPENLPVTERPYAKQKAALFDDPRVAAGLSIRHLNYKGTERYENDEIETTRTRIAMMSNAIVDEFFNGDTNPDPKKFAAAMKREYGPNAFVASDQNLKNKTLSPETALALMRTHRSNLGDKIAITGGSFQSRKTTGKYMKGPGAEETQLWYRDGVQHTLEEWTKQLGNREAAEKAYDDQIRYENLYSANRGVAEAMDMGTRAQLARHGLEDYPRPMDVGEEEDPLNSPGLQKTFQGEMVGGPKLTPFGQSKRAGANPKNLDLQPRETVSDRIQHGIDLGTTMVKPDNRTRWYTDARNRIRANRMDRAGQMIEQPEIQQAQARSWGGYQEQVQKSPEKNLPFAKSAKASVDSYGGPKAVFGGDRAAYEAARDSFDFGENKGTRENPFTPEDIKNPGFGLRIQTIGEIFHGQPKDDPVQIRRPFPHRGFIYFGSTRQGTEDAMRSGSYKWFDPDSGKLKEAGISSFLAHKLNIFGQNAPDSMLRSDFDKLVAQASGEYKYRADRGYTPDPTGGGAQDEIVHALTFGREPRFGVTRDGKSDPNIVTFEQPAAAIRWETLEGSDGEDIKKILHKQGYDAVLASDEAGNWRKGQSWQDDPSTPSGSRMRPPAGSVAVFPESIHKLMTWHNATEVPLKSSAGSIARDPDTGEKIRRPVELLYPIADGNVPKAGPFSNLKDKPGPAAQKWKAKYGADYPAKGAPGKDAPSEQFTNPILALAEHFASQAAGGHSTEAYAAFKDFKNKGPLDGDQLHKVYKAWAEKSGFDWQNGAGYTEAKNKEGLASKMLGDAKINVLLGKAVDQMKVVKTAEKTKGPTKTQYGKKLDVKAETLKLNQALDQVEYEWQNSSTYPGMAKVHKIVMDHYLAGTKPGILDPIKGKEHPNQKGLDAIDKILMEKPDVPGMPEGQVPYEPTKEWEPGDPVTVDSVKQVLAKEYGGKQAPKTPPPEWIVDYYEKKLGKDAGAKLAYEGEVVYNEAKQAMTEAALESAGFGAKYKYTKSELKHMLDSHDGPWEPKDFVELKQKMADSGYELSDIINHQPHLKNKGTPNVGLGLRHVRAGEVSDSERDLSGGFEDASTRNDAFRVTKNGKDTDAVLTAHYDDRSKTIHVGWMGSTNIAADSVELGPATVRETLRDLKNFYPGAERIVTARVTGARKKAALARTEEYGVDDKENDSDYHWSYVNKKIPVGLGIEHAADDFPWKRPTDQDAANEYQWEFMRHGWSDRYPNITEDDFVKHVKNAPVVEFSPEQAKHISNATFSTEGSLRSMVSTYRHPRDVDSIMRGLENGDVPLPIVVRHGDSLTMLGGNTRMNSAYIKGKPLKALVVDLTQKPAAARMGLGIEHVNEADKEPVPEESLGPAGPPRGGSGAPPSANPPSGAPPDPLPKYAQSINLNRLTGTDEMKRAILEVSKMIPRNRPTSIDESLAAVRKLGFTDESALQLAKQAPEFRAKMLAIRGIHARVEEEYVAAKNAYRDDPTPENFEQYKSSLAKNLKMFRAGRDVASEAGRILWQQRIQVGSDLKGIPQTRRLLDVMISEIEKKHGKIPDQVARELSKVDFEDEAQMKRFLHYAAPYAATFRKKLFEVINNFLLSGPKTHIVNTASNIAFDALRVGESAVAGGISALRGKSRERYVGQASADVLGQVGGFMDGLKTFKDSMLQGYSDASKIEHLPAIGGRTGKIIRLPTTFLGAADDMAKSINSRGVLYSEGYRIAAKKGLGFRDAMKEAARLADNPTPEMMEKALTESLYRSFQQPSGKLTSAAMKLREAAPGSEYIFPYIKTPINIMKAGVERIGPVNGAWILSKLAKGEKLGPGVMEDELAKVAVGTTFMAVVGAAVAAGSMSGGGPADPDQKKRLLATGWQPYSFRVPDGKGGSRWVSYSRGEPFSTFMGSVADSTEIMRELSYSEQREVISHLALGFARNVTSKTYMQGLSEAIDALQDPQRFGERAIGGKAGMVIPSAIAQVAAAQDPYLRDARSIIDTVKLRILGLRQTVPPRRDEFGKEIPSAGGGFWSRFLNPMPISPDRGGPLQQTMVDLGLTIPELPRQISFGGSTLKLGGEEYDVFSQLAGAAVHRKLGLWEARPELFAKLPPEMQRKKVETAIRDGRAEGKEAMHAWLLKHPDTLKALMKTAARKEINQEPANNPYRAYAH